MLRLISCGLLLFPQITLAGPASVRIPGYYNGKIAPPAPNTVPDVMTNAGVQQAQGATVTYPSNNETIINQNLGQQQAIINWSSFNIGSNASVMFNQGTGTPGTQNWIPNNSYVALNRIWDANPSLIFGKLTANGTIYLINQNGILFGPGSTVNVGGLVASALNIIDANFLNNTLQFTQENYSGNGLLPSANIYVSNDGDINAAEGGYVFLIGPNVENYGTINAPTGQIGLAAGTNVQLVPPSDNNLSRSAYYVLINDDFSNAPAYGTAVNGKDTTSNAQGQLYADGGLVGMYGYNVEQDGVIRSITAYKNKQGQVELRAANDVTTGPGSQINLSVDQSIDPATGQIVTVDDTFNIQPVVNIGGLFRPGASDADGDWPTNKVNTINLSGAIIAPTGQVTLDTSSGVTMYAGLDGLGNYYYSSIDVSGVVANLPASVLSGKLTSTELANDDQQKTGLLLGQTITTLPTAGSSIGNISDWILTQERTALERSIGGAMTVNSSGNYVAQDGLVAINVSNGGINIQQGALINISGGMINYESGFVNTTKLVSGMKVYDITDAPLNLRYDMVLGNYQQVYSRWGVVENYSGDYYGGAPSETYVQGYSVGGAAGTLTLQANTVNFNGTLTGGITPGTYQTAMTMPGSYSSAAAYQTALALSIARGLEMPTAGTLNLMLTGTEGSILVAPDTQTASSQAENLTVLSTKMLGNDPNKPNLSNISLSLPGEFSTDTDAAIYLQPGGSFSVSAGRIEHDGSITVNSGTISMMLIQPTSSPTVDERIILASDSILDVSGQKTDNRLSGTTATGITQGGNIEIMDETDQGAGVFIESNALVDVSGGYNISLKGNVSGGNAGTLTIQGSNIMLNGDIQGYALAAPNGNILGGSVTLISTKIHVVTQSEADDWSNFNALTDNVPATPGGTLVKGELHLAGNRFDDTGFTQITLDSVDDLTVDTNISPSFVRLSIPSLPGPAQPAYGSEVPGNAELIRLFGSMDYMAGPSSVNLGAGIPFAGSSSVGSFTGNLIYPTDSTATITVFENATVNTAPALSSVARTTGYLANPTAVTTGINLTAPNIDIQGTLESPGGSISAQATNGDLTVEGGAVISAQGYSLPNPSSTPKGLPMNYTPINGGNVTLTAAAASGSGGNVTLAANATIDVSGSDPVNTTLSTTNGSYYAFTDASNPGSLSLNFYDTLIWDAGANINASGKISGLQGGTLSVTNTNPNGVLTVGNADFAKYAAAGFDDVSLVSRGSLQFSGDINATLGRQLTLDAPLFISDGNNVTLTAPWIVLADSYRPYTLLSYLKNQDNSNVSSTLSGNLTLTSTGFLDVLGAISFIDVTSITNNTANGFSNVTLQAGRDIRLSEAYYNMGDQSTGSSGTLLTAGNLVLDADRVYGSDLYIFDTSASAYKSTIYPDVFSTYNIQAYGKVTMQHSHTDGIVYSMDTPIYSAGSNLTIEGGEGIDVLSGVTVAAPLGTITLSVPDGQEMHLSPGSTLTVAGDSSLSVLYNSVSTNDQWIVDQSYTNFTSGNPIPFTELPQKGITLNAGATGTIIVDNNATIDVSDGGSLFSYTWQPGLAGTNNPLALSGEYVVFKANSFPMPGETVYLDGGGGLSAGLYTMLPLGSNNAQNYRYAFMQGAYILNLQTGAAIPGSSSGTNQGYPLIVGYTGVAGTQIQSARPQVYSVMTAAEVLQEGDFSQVGPMQANSAGDIAISGGTVVLNGSVQTGSGGGKISLNAPNIVIQLTATNAQAEGNMYVSEDFLSNKNFSEIDLGNDNTQTVVIAQGVELNAGALVLTANNTTGPVEPSITLQSGSNLGENASGQSITNDITLSTMGVLNIDPNAVIHAKSNITLDVNDLSSITVAPQDILKVDSSSLTLESTNIFFGAEGGKLPSEVGLYLTQNMLKRFSSYQNLTLESANDIEFLDSSVNSLSAANKLTLDASRILSLNNMSVIVAAQTVNIQNSGTAFNGAVVPSNGGSFTVGNADSTTNPVTQINIGSGDALFAGFSNIDLNSNGDVVFKGAGSLVTGGANLNIAALRVTTAADTKSDGTYDAPNFKVVAGNSINDLNPAGIITMTSIDNGQANTTPAPGGTLEFDARKIDVGLVIQVDGGDITLKTSGALDSNGNFLPYTEDANGNFSDGIVLRNGGQILAMGTGSAPGGMVNLSTDFVNNNTGAVVSGQSGKIDLQSGSLINVSAGGQGDAGQVTLLAPGEGVVINGLLKGTAGTNADNSAGLGGSLVLDTNSITDFTWLQANVEGFTESLDLRARQGNIEIASNNIITAHNITLTADDTSTDANGNLLGNIDVYGQINASAGGKYADGGTVELYAQNNSNVQSGGQVLATGANGGYVLLSSVNGGVNINSGGLVNVSGSGGTGQTNGTVYLRARRSAELGSTMNINLAPNTINGAAVVSAEAFWVYANNQSGDITPWLTGSGGPLANASTYYANTNGNVTSMLANATGNNGPAVYLLPGIEVDSTGDITIASALDLTSYKYGSSNNVPGVLTLRSANNLNLEANLVDHPTPIGSLNSNLPLDSWGFNLIAGTDTSSADYMAVNKGLGNLTIGNGIVVYTENAPLRIASGNNTIIGQGNGPNDPMPGYMISNTMDYNLASYGGAIKGNVGGDLIINGGAIQTAMGDIDITVGGDLQLNAITINGATVLGAIRTTGEASGANISQYWTYAGGGNITLNVGGSVGTYDNSTGTLYFSPNIAPYSWDQFYSAGSGLVSGRWRSPITITAGSNDTIVFTYDNVTYTTTLPAGTYNLVGTSSSNSFTNILETALDSAINANGQTIEGISFNVSKSTSGGLQISFYSPLSGDQVTMFTGGTLAATALLFGSSNDNIPNVIPYGLWAASYTSGTGMTLTNGLTPDYGVTSGVATMGGGNLTVRTGGNFLAQAGTFGGAYCSILGGAYCQGTSGNLIIYAGGDVMGRFLNAYGTAEINAMGNFGAPQGSTYNTVQIELFNSQMTVNAQGVMQIGAIVNPTMASDQQLSQNNNLIGGTYTQNTSITLRAGGDVTIYGISPVYSVQNNTSILPATVDIESTGGNINLQSYDLTLTSSPTGNLTLIAAGDITELEETASTKMGVPNGIMMSDIDPAKWYGYFSSSSTNWSIGTAYNFHDPGSTGTQPLHAVLASDTDAVIALKEQPIIVSAGGNIVDLGLTVPKKAEVTAGGDIINMTYEGQNISAQDVSAIAAGGNIQMLYVYQTTNALGQLQGSKTGFVEGGPGVFWVQAGGSIDLGSSNNITDDTGALQSYGGIQAIGNANNSLLDTEKSTLVVVSGYALNKSASADDISTFFSEINAAGNQYAQLVANGNSTAAATLLQTTREDTIAPFLGTPSGDGNIDMVESQIGSSVGASDIFVIANGTINLGVTALPVSSAASPATTGIWTGGGGSVNVFANQDINVNQSRIMTYFGGDITVWSDKGNINAGEGSRTAVSASPPRKQTNPTTHLTTWTFTPPAVGSGIRAVTYGENPPPPGNIYLFAPSGIIDAGDAGISGGEVVLAALEVRNVANVSFSLGSIGVPLASTGATAIGTLSGSGTLTQSSLSSDTAAISGANLQASQMIENIIAKWLEVQVIDFVVEDSDQQY